MATAAAVASLGRLCNERNHDVADCVILTKGETILDAITVAETLNKNQKPAMADHPHHLEIKQTMEKLACQVAKCKLSPRSTLIHPFFATKLQRIKLHDRATWKRAQHKSGNATDSLEVQLLSQVESATEVLARNARHEEALSTQLCHSSRPVIQRGCRHKQAVQTDWSKRSSARADQSSKRFLAPPSALPL